MSDFLSNVGNFFGSSTGKGLESLAGLGATGAGLYGNLSAEAQRAAAAKQAQANANLTPAQLAAQVNQATQPLNANLVQAITGNVNANMAEQGLSQAPGLQAAAIAQGLAGPEQAQQQQAMQLVLAKLGLPASFANTIPQNANLAPLLSLLFKGGTPGSTFQMPFNLSAPPNPGAQTQGTYDFGSLIPPAAPLSADTTGTYDFGSLVPPSGGA